MRFILLAGVNGSGKSTMVKEEPHIFDGLKMVNPDEIQKE
ncbi:MAG: ATPase [Alphaproteobacteria bacterium]